MAFRVQQPFMFGATKVAFRPEGFGRRVAGKEIAMTTLPFATVGKAVTQRGAHGLERVGMHASASLSEG